MKLSDDLAWRGLIKDKTFTDITWLDEPKTFYHGIDTSVDSLTIGNLAALMLARRLIEARWQAIILVGGATSLVGDPGGKLVERELIDRTEVKNNTKAIKSQINNLFGGQKFELVDNFEWFVGGYPNPQPDENAGMLFIDFLRDFGKKFSMTELMQREFVSERIGKDGAGISYAEFSYGLVQAYDFFRLSLPKGKKDGQDVKLQIGGSDQWSNMLLGVSLARKKGNNEVHALSMPLVVDKATGRKFGKTEAGAVWLDAKKTSPTQFYQFWINVGDEDVESYLKIFTLMSKEQIEQVMGKHKSEPAQRQAQKTLAEEVTQLVHDEASESASDVTKYLTSQVSITEASESELEAIRQEIPSAKAESGGSVTQTLIKSGLAPSNTEARRLLLNGAIYVNGKPISRDKFESSDFHNGRLLLRRGKAYKDSALIELE
jgi:tyrosyl-tRNA synthetase